MNTTVRVMNLDVSVDASALEDMCSMIGEVRTARVDKGIGYVEMSNREEMENCIHHFHGQVLNGLPLMVGEDKPHVFIPRPAKAKRASGSKSARR